MNDVYCSNKFTYLKIDTDHRLAYNCHTALPHPIDVDWLEKNPGRIFNTPLMHQERKEMLANIKNKSCWYQCYKAESLGQKSVRENHINDILIDQIDIQPTTLDITLGSDCKLTCVYCQTDFSSAWRKDIINNGEYDIIDADDWQNTMKKTSAMVLDRVSQKDKSKRKFNEILIREISILKKKLKKLVLSGGEPFLSNDLINILELCRDVPEIIIYSGLGISDSRFKNLINKIKNFKNIKISISNESVDKWFEFNRAGSSWSLFLEKLNYLKEQNINFQFNCILSNVTLINIDKFLRFCSDNNYSFEFRPLVYPDFLRIHILDNDSKQNIKKKLKIFENQYPVDKILQGIDFEPTDNEIRNCSVYLKEFARRRNFDTNIFGENFNRWLKIEEKE